jgi:hypothetical protein
MKLKRKLLFASAAMVLTFTGLLTWFIFGRGTAISSSFPPELSREDLKQIHQAIRGRLWGNTLPSFSLQTLKTSAPRLLLFATTRIRKIELARSTGQLAHKPSHNCVLVETHSSCGDCLFIVAKARDGKHPWFCIQQIRGPGGLQVFTSASSFSVFQRGSASFSGLQGYGTSTFSLFTFRLGTSVDEVYTLSSNGSSNSLFVGPIPVLPEPDRTAWR